MREIVLPTPAEIDDVVAGVFSSLGVEIIDIPFTLESARSSFLKTVQKIPPSDKTQEFKDGVLWANCLDLLEQDDVLLASNDKAFWRNREIGRGLAENLVAESSQKPYRFILAQSVTEVLSHIVTPIHVDEPWLMAAVRERAHNAAAELLSRGGAEASGEARIRYELFATENPELLYFTYSIESPCTDLTGDDRTNMTLVLKGSGTLRPIVPQLEDVHVGEEKLIFTNADGSVGETRNLYISGHFVMGHRTITHSIRYPLKGTG